jgi:hypothetical protein
MEHLDARPVDFASRGELFEEFELGGAGRDENAGAAPVRDRATDRDRSVGRRGMSELPFVVEDEGADRDLRNGSG